jgi:hypothetical protein
MYYGKTTIIFIASKGVIFVVLGLLFIIGNKPVLL